MESLILRNWQRNLMFTLMFSLQTHFLWKCTIALCDSSSSSLPITQFSQINQQAGNIYSRWQSVDSSFVFLFCRAGWESLSGCMLNLNKLESWHQSFIDLCHSDTFGSGISPLGSPKEKNISWHWGFMLHCRYFSSKTFCFLLFEFDVISVYLPVASVFHPTPFPLFTPRLYFPPFFSFSLCASLLLPLFPSSFLHLTPKNVHCILPSSPPIFLCLSVWKIQASFHLSGPALQPHNRTHTYSVQRPQDHMLYSCLTDSHKTNQSKLLCHPTVFGVCVCVCVCVCVWL